MPAKRRWAKQRLDRAAQRAAWRIYLTCGRDFFGDLKQIGLGEPLDPSVVEAAWRGFGSEVLASFEPTSYRSEPWGLMAFGLPE